MKKNILLTLGLVALCLTGCNKKAADFSNLTIITPNGAPSLCFYDFTASDNFEINKDPQLIKSIMDAGQKDVVVLPTNVGIQSITKVGSPYKIAATITFGNFYVASLGNDDNGVMEATDTILLFQQNNVPDKLFHYVYGNELDAGIYYVNAVSDVKDAIVNGFFVDNKTESGARIVPNYVLIAEPVLTAVKSKVTEYANIQTEYRKKSNNKDIFQASVFIKNSVEEEVGKAFLEKLEGDINGAFEDSNKMFEGMNRIEKPDVAFGVAPQMATNLLKANNAMGLGFKKAKDHKAEIDQFLSLFNITETNEEIYF